MLLGNASRGRLVARVIREAPIGWARLGALRGQPPLAGEAVRFMGPAFWVPWGRPPIDVVFLDRQLQVVAVIPRLAAWRGTGPVEQATSCVVLEADACERVPIRVGDRLEFTPTTGERIAAGAKPPMTF